jgi:hypothetical protein
MQEKIVYQGAIKKQYSFWTIMLKIQWHEIPEKSLIQNLDSFFD